MGLEGQRVTERAAPFRRSRDAKDFIRTFVDSGDITKDESDKMCKLLDRYSKFR